MASSGALREQYTRVTQIIKLVTGQINGIVFVALAKNIFLICITILRFHSDE